MSKQSYYLLSVLVLIVLVGYYIQDTIFLHRHWSRVKEQTNSLTQQVKQLFTQQVVLDEDEIEVANTKYTLAQWHGRLIKSADVPMLLQEVEKIGRKNHLDIKSFDMNGPRKLNDYQQVTVNISAISNYYQATHFMDQLVMLPWLVAINHVSLGGFQPDGSMSCAFELTIYSVKE